MTRLVVAHILELMKHLSIVMKHQNSIRSQVIITCCCWTLCYVCVLCLFFSTLMCVFQEYGFHGWFHNWGSICAPLKWNIQIYMWSIFKRQYSCPWVIHDRFWNFFWFLKTCFQNSTQLPEPIHPCEIFGIFWNIPQVIGISWRSSEENF